MAQLIQYNTFQPIQVFPENSAEGFSLEELYRLLECRIIQVIYLSAMPGYILIIDEEGKFRKDAQERANEWATTLLRAGDHMPGDWITGHALLVKDDGTEFQ